MKLIAPVLCFALILAACGQTRSTEGALDDGDVVASVTGENVDFEISSGELNTLVSDAIAFQNSIALEGEEIPAEEIDQAIIDARPNILTLAIYQSVLEGELGANDIELTDEILADAEADLRTQIESSGQLEADDFLTLDTEYANLIRDNSYGFYAFQQVIQEEAANGDIDVPQNVCVSHILTLTQPEADPETGVAPELTEDEAALFAEEAKGKIDVARQRVVDGEDFGEIAAELSEGPSATQNGDLGCVPTSAWDPVFGAVADEAEIDEISEAFETQFGWHILTVTDRPEPSEEDFALAAQTELETRFLAAVGAAEITVNETVGTWDGASQSVVPPIADAEVDIVPSDGATPEVDVEATEEAETEE